VIKRNRALAYLKTKQYDAALCDTGYPNLITTTSEKALFRAAEALYHLGRYSECCELLERLHTTSPTNQQASKVLNRAKSRVLEHTTGEYDFGDLQKKAKHLRPPLLDAATYVGPVEIRQTQNKGRGLFVNRAVKAGDLLLCEKAFSYAYVVEDGESKGERSSQLSVLLNTETERGFLGGQADLLQAIVQKLHRNPSLAKAFTKLYHGSYEAVTTSAVDEEPVVDT
jgi:tetratricopeptide (TPR) repeat protein